MSSSTAVLLHVHGELVLAHPEFGNMQFHRGALGVRRQCRHRERPVDCAHDYFGRPACGGFSNSRSHRCEKTTLEAFSSIGDAARHGFRRLPHMKNSRGARILEFLRGEGARG